MKLKFLTLALIILMNIILINANSFYYDLSSEYNNGKIQVNSVNVVFSQDNLNESIGDYNYKIKGFNNEILYSANFPAVNQLIYESGEENITDSQLIEANNFKFNLIIPYYINAKEIVIYDENKKEIGKEDVSYFSRIKTSNLDNIEGQIVGNDKDEHGCIGSVGYSWCQEKNKCLRSWEETCLEQINNNIINFKNSNIYIIILSIILILLIIVIIFIFFPKTKKKR